MACCPNGIYIPLVLDCNEEVRLLQSGERLRVDEEIIGGGISSSPTLVTITSDTILTEDNTVVMADATSGSLTVDLPAGSDGAKCTVKKIDSSANTVTIDGDGAETIDGATTAIISVQYAHLTVLYFDGEWRTL